MYVPVPYNQMQQYQGQPQNLQMPNGQQVMAYPAPPQAAKGMQPMGQQQMQQVGQPSAAGPSAGQASDGRQSQIVEFYGVAR